MKKLFFLHAFVAIIASQIATVTNTMDKPAKKKKQEIKSVSLISVRDAIPYNSSNYPETSRILLETTYANQTFPLLLDAEMECKMTTKQANLAFERICKINPDVAAAASNDPNVKANCIAQMTQNMTIGVPVECCINKKSGDFVMYQGLTDPSHGLTQTINGETKTTLFSAQKDDPAFIEKPFAGFIATEQFCKQANIIAHRFDSQLKAIEVAEGKVAFVDGNYNPSKIIGDEFGITSGSFGGKPLMDTDAKNRTQLARPR